MKGIYRPPVEEAEKCLAIRRISKRGGYSPSEDHKLCYKLANKYPEWYSATETIIFNDTVPFGSFAHHKVDYEYLASMKIRGKRSPR